MPPTGEQGKLRFPGLREYISCSVSIGHGITPSVFTVTTTPGMYNPNVAGNTLELTYGSVTIRFPGCKVDLIAYEKQDRGEEFWTLPIFDRRWRWKECGRISGVYNVKENPGDEKFVPGTEKTPRELAILCLKAMGETNYNVTKLPNTGRPAIEWDYDLPAECLQRIAEQYGCRVVLKLDNSVWLEPMGIGAMLPEGGSVVAKGDTLDSPERPDALVIVAAKTECQVDLLLEAVGLDRDGMYKPFAELSYKEKLSNGFNTIDQPFFEGIVDRDDGLASEIRELAQQSIFKCYRPIVPFTLPQLQWGGSPRVITNLREIQLTDHQCDLKKATQGTKKAFDKPEALPPWVYGIWCDGDTGHPNVTNTIDPTLLKQHDVTTGYYPYDFEIDQLHGIIRFSNIVYRTLPSTQAQGMEYRPAILRLRIALNVRDAKTLGWIRYERKRTFPGPRFGTLPRYIKKEEVGMRVVTHYNASFGVVNVVTNNNACNQVADGFLDAHEREYIFQSPQIRSYVGFLAINPDGAICQVSWEIDGEGKCFTRASRNTEEFIFQPSYAEKRQHEMEKNGGGGFDGLRPGLPTPKSLSLENSRGGGGFSNIRNV